jgi:hypothetical protein
MIKAKHFVIVVLVLGILQLTFAEKRAKPMPLEELTNPDSPSYVPYPYPETRKEIIEDLKYAIKKLCDIKDGEKEVFIGNNRPFIDKVLLSVLLEKGTYKIGKIIKVRHLRVTHAYDYMWLIFIMNKDNSVAARVILMETGLWGLDMAHHPDRGPSFLETEDEIIGKLGVTIGRSLKKSDIKHVDYVDMSPGLSRLIYPVMEITLADGFVYYYSTGRKKIYRIKENICWKKRENGFRPQWNEVVSNKDIFAFDYVNDRIIVFEEVKKNR